MTKDELIKKLTALKTKVSEITTNLAVAESKQKDLFKILKDEYKCENVEEGDALYEKLTQEVEEKQKELDKACADIEEALGEC